MAINDEIAAGGRPVQFENPLNNMVKFSNIQNDMANMALHRQKMEASTAAAARQGQLDRYLAGGGRDESIIYGLGGVKDLAEIRQGKEAQSRGEKTDAETEALHILPYAAEYGRLDNRNEAISLTKHMYANPKLQNAPFRARTLEQAIAAIPDDTTPEGKIAFKDYASKNALGAKEYADKQLLSFAVEGGNYVGRNKITGAIVSSSPISLTAEQALYAPTDLESKQAKYKALAKETADQEALIARAGTAGLPGTADMLAEQQKQRTVKQDALRGEIDVLQKQGQTVKNTTIAPIQLLNELDLLVKNGKGDSQRAKDVRGLIDKEKHIAETESYTDAGLALAAEMVRNGVVPPRGGKGAINAAAAAGVTAKDYVEGKTSIGALGALNKQQALTGAFEKTFNANADATLKAGLALNGRSGVPIIDEYISNPFAKATGKNPELAGFKVYLKGTLNEYAKIVSGTTGNAAVAQAEIKRMTDLLNSAQTREQLISTINAMKAEVANRRKGFIEQKAEMRGEPVAPAEAEVAAPHAHPKTKGRDTTNPLLTPR
jgi:hypothetical protein